MTRSRTILAISIIIVLGLVALAAWQWSRYTRSPQYSLAQLILASNEGDWAEAKRYIDINAVTYDLADRLVEQNLGPDSPLSDEIRDIADAAKPTIARQVEEQLRKGIEAQDGKNGPRQYWGAFWTTADARRTRNPDGTENVALAVQFKGRRYPLVFRMKRERDLWRIIAIEDLPGLIGDPAQVEKAPLRGPFHTRASFASTR